MKLNKTLILYDLPKLQFSFHHQFGTIEGHRRMFLKGGIPI
jgi:hypothetical protein